jgi:hypothetical protein
VQFLNAVLETCRSIEEEVWKHDAMTDDGNSHFAHVSRTPASVPPLIPRRYGINIAYRDVGTTHRSAEIREATRSSSIPRDPLESAPAIFERARHRSSAV